MDFLEPRFIQREILGSFTSAQLAAALTDETGSGAAVFATSPSLVTPALGTPSSGILTNCTGTASGLTAGSVTTNANLAGHVTSVGNAAVLGSFTAAQLNTAVSDADLITSGGALGTPSSGNLANCTFPTLNQNTTGSSGSCSGNAATATTLATPRLLNGRSFNGSADINHPGLPFYDVATGQVYSQSPESTDLNLCISAGDYNFIDTSTNKPAGITGWGYLHVARHWNPTSGSVYVHQTAYDMNGTNVAAVYVRRGVPLTGYTCTWSAWKRLMDEEYGTFTGTTSSIVSSNGAAGYGAFYAQGSGTNSAYLFLGNVTDGELARISADTGGNIYFGPAGNITAITMNSAGGVTFNQAVSGVSFSGAGTGLTGTAASLTAGNVTTNANLTGHITSTGNAAVLGSFTIAQLNTAVSDANLITDGGALGTPSSGVATNLTGTATGLTAGTATQAYNLVGSGTVSPTATGGAGLYPTNAANASNATNAVYSTNATNLNGGIIATSAPVVVSTSTHTVAATTSILRITYVGTCTLALPAAASYPGRILEISRTTANPYVSANSNVCSITSDTPGTTMSLSGFWQTFQSDGTYWRNVRGSYL